MTFTPNFYQHFVTLYLQLLVHQEEKFFTISCVEPDLIKDVLWVYAQTQNKRYEMIELRYQTEEEIKENLRNMCS